MERSFKKEVQALKLGDGETFRGEGILAVTKALLQSGVAYVGGYQGAPVSHLLDVLVDAEDMLGELGVHLETCTNEAAAAAMLGASINYPLRGAVTWKSIVGTNVAADALSNLASPGVIGGALIILGEDYGEGASVIQERSHAYALKSSMWLLDPRPDLPTIVRMVEKGFELSEASHAPVMLELRIRACHVTGEFAAKDNRRAGDSRQQPHRRSAALRLRPARASAGRPSRRRSSRSRSGCRPRSASSREHKLNEFFAGDLADLGIIVLGGLTNVRAARARAARPRRPLRHDAACRSTCSTSPIRWCPTRCATSAPASAPCWSSRKALPTTSSRRSTPSCAAPTSRPACYGKDALPTAGEYTAEVLHQRARRRSSPRRGRRHRRRRRSRDARDAMLAHKARRRRGGRRHCRRGRRPSAPAVPSGRCSRAIKLMQRELGPTHISRRHRLPFVRDLRAVQPRQLDPRLRHVARERGRGRRRTCDRRPISVMGDGGFWHNGLITGVASQPVQQGRRRADRHAERLHLGDRPAISCRRARRNRQRRARPAWTSSRRLRSLGVKWLRTVRTYSVATMVEDPARRRCAPPSAASR